MNAATSDLGNASDELYLVFSRPAEVVTDSEFHMSGTSRTSKILTTPGFKIGTAIPAFAGCLRLRRGSELPLSRPVRDRRRHRGTPRARVESGEIVLPSWFKTTRYLTWSCYPVSDRVEQA